MLILLKEADSHNIYSLSKQFGPLKIHSFAIRKSLPLVNNFTLPELKKIYRHLLRADVQSKIGLAAPEKLISLLIGKLAG